MNQSDNIILGKQGEEQAVNYLQNNGYIILDKRWKHKRFEIDIIAKNHNTLIFLEVKTRRIGGANYQVPIEVPKNRQFFLASKWIISSAKGRSGKSMSERLATEFISAANNEGGAIKKKEDVHRMAEANRAFAHFR